MDTLTLLESLALATTAGHLAYMSVYSCLGGLVYLYDGRPITRQMAAAILSQKR